MDLKKLYEENRVYMEEYSQISENMVVLKREYERNLANLLKKEDALVKKYTKEIENYWGRKESVSKFYYAILKEYEWASSPLIELNTKRINGNMSTYEFFKKAIEKYKNTNYILIKVVTPDIIEHSGREWDERDYETVVDNLLIPANVLGKFTTNIHKMNVLQYSRILELDGIYKIGSSFKYGQHDASVKLLDETNLFYHLSLNENKPENKSILEFPINPKYDKGLEDVLFKTLEYSLKLKKLEKMILEQEKVEKELISVKNLEKRKKSLQNQIDNFNVLEK